VPNGDAGPPYSGTYRRPGLRASIARVGSAAVGLLSTRAELLSVELAEERTRVARMIALVAAGGVLLAFAMMFAGAFVIALFWDTYRLAAIAFVAVVHLGVGLVLLSKARSVGSDAPAPFASTLDELRKDRELLQRSLADTDPLA
jgi:uncharacterized membrane protein YqjE